VIVQVLKCGIHWAILVILANLQGMRCDSPFL